jgi:hypothetical protein
MAVQKQRLESVFQHSSNHRSYKLVNVHGDGDINAINCTEGPTSDGMAASSKPELRRTHFGTHDRAKSKDTQIRAGKLPINR